LKAGEILLSFNRLCCTYWLKLEKNLNLNSEIKHHILRLSTQKAGLVKVLFAYKLVTTNAKKTDDTARQ
jgi:hypothetical protein